MQSLQEILEAVAAGTLAPQEASELIGAAGTRDQTTSAVPQVPLTDIYIKAAGARLVVIGDPSVAEAVADGAHTMERSGSTLLVTTNMSEGAFSASPPRSALLNWITSVVDRAGQTLTVRVNPDVPIRILLVGGTLDLSGVHAATSVGVEAGSAKLQDGSGALQLDVVSGSAKVDWTFAGESSVRADMGSAQVRARLESDVRVTAEAVLGQAVVKTDSGMVKSVGEAATPEVIVGAGSGTLHAAARMGSVSVTVG